MTLHNKPLTDFTLWELHEQQVILSATASDTKTRQAELQEELTRRLGAGLDTALGGNTGTARIALPDGLEAVRETKKEVEWDSPKLMAVAKTMAWERAAAIFKIEFSMSEMIYRGISAADPELAAQLITARTMTPKPGAVKIERKAA